MQPPAIPSGSATSANTRHCTRTTQRAHTAGLGRSLLPGQERAGLGDGEEQLFLDYGTGLVAGMQMGLAAPVAVSLSGEAFPAAPNVTQKAPDGMQIAAAFHIPIAAAKNTERITEAIRSNSGFGWHEHDPELFEGTERFFRSGYVANLVSSWIPALDGVEEKLRDGAKVADVGCGHGASTLLLGESYPRSQITGFDYHNPSIEQARKRATAAGLAARVSFETAAADFPGTEYDLVAIFDALHDMPDPLGAARHIREALKPDGTFLLVEPFANDKLEDNINPVGRLYYGRPRSSVWPTR